MPTGSTPPASAKSSDEVARAKHAEIKGTRTNAEVQAEAVTDAQHDTDEVVKPVHGKTVSDFQRSVKAADPASMPPLPASAATGTSIGVDDDGEEVALQETPIEAKVAVDEGIEAVEPAAMSESSPAVAGPAADEKDDEPKTLTDETSSADVPTADPQVDSETKHEQGEEVEEAPGPTEVR